jgi:hypothetical protein
MFWYSFRFVRSVIRIFVVFNVEMSPGQSKKKSLQAANQPVQRCKRVFQALLAIALEELCETANALLAPVRFGISKPTAPFNLTSGDMIAVEELLAVEPLAPRNHNSNSTSSSTGAQSRRSRSRSLTEGLRNSTRSESGGRLTSSGANASSSAVQASVSQMVNFRFILLAFNCFREYLLLIPHNNKNKNFSYLGSWIDLKCDLK